VVVKRKSRCKECRGPLDAISEITGSGEAFMGLCEPCWTTPPEIRSREINGCMSHQFMPSAEEYARTQAEKRQAHMDACSSTVHRSRFRIAHVIKGVER
jgi:hypothetical protein